ncbi:amino acid transporter [Halohasta litchfieldiae]|jgi:amino acid transporter|uniref:Amino acid/polyamine/organocation transporter, APC superfamily n=1 Tax=Halohasta litchfieldiae TaxID=1073996 RepID=A0A1H6UNI2_9EURY|nr:amino acid permease [Halohasta litchfieldiae]ATW87445.1 amino acid transporter [Halohasta litchfieldiae]SEI89472.1 amino acid/polyamine/organocation transporter, APC superfamily [Halohasta litchfieldiae]
MKELERDLGLPSVLAISIGAMIGSGIFILPALALEIAGPAVIVAYLLAGLLVVPAALSKSEMATAMPEAGGTYIYIERGMGPLLGTIAGVGTWFSLSFKGALALVGGVPYLLLIFDLPLKPVALGLATVLILVNIFGAKQTGRLQLVIVVVMLAALGWFAAGSAPSVQSTNYANFFADGLGGLLAATGLVFVSYAGVTKVASVAEEIEDPGRNIPLGILGSLAFTTVLYVAIVAVLVGVTDPGSVAGSLTPVAVAAEATLGQVGVAAVIIAAILALISTANAGILSSSRYPFAMSRDQLAPPSLSTVSERFGTPVTSITLTGAVLLVLIAFVPILEIAKLASAFQIMVFGLINIALIAFREGSMEYEPEFTSPLYPWMQIFGAITGALLLTQMGAVALVGALVIILGSILWYFVYVRARVNRDGAASDAIRRQVGRNALTDVAAVTEDDTQEVLVALTKDVDETRERSLVALAADIVRPNDGRVVVVRFEEIPDQAPLTENATIQSSSDRSFETRITELEAEYGVDIEADEIVSHDTKHAIVNFADHRGVDTILAEHEPLRLRSRLVGDPIDWVVRHAPCDVLLIDNLGYGRPKRVILSGDGGPYAPLAVTVGEAVAAANDGAISLWYPAGNANTDQYTQTIDDYQSELSELLSVPVTAEPIRTDGGQTQRPDLLVRRGSDHRLRDALFDDRPTVPSPGCTAVTVYPHESQRPPLVRRLLERVLF